MKALLSARSLIALVLTSSLVTAMVTSAATLHTRTNGDDSLPGTSWETAKRTVGAAVAVAATGDEIWVAEGIYHEHLELDRSVALYGGFQGAETSLGERDSARHRSILDGSGTGIVVTMRGGGAARVLDGFTIQNGLNTGIHCLDTAFVIRSNIIRANLCGPEVEYGGGIHVSAVSDPAAAVIEHNLILDNYAFDGGAIACLDASPRITHNTIAWNLAAQNGGGISCWRNSSPLIANNLFIANTASLADGGLPVPVGGGAIFATADDLDGRPYSGARSSPVIRNNLIAANGARHGGGITLIDANLGVPRVENNTVVVNSGAGIVWASSQLIPIAPVIRNNLVAFNARGLEQLPGTPTNAIIEFNCVHGNAVRSPGADYVGLPDRTGSHGNFAADPRFASVDFLNFHLQPDSPCIDAGLNPTNPPPFPDMDEQPRIAGGRIDVGADESDGTRWQVTVPVYRVSTDGDDTRDGQSWATAMKTVQRAIDAAKWAGSEVWVAAGTYREHLWLPAFVHLYGGFAGNETDRTARNFEQPATVLDGTGTPRVVSIPNGGYRVCRLDGFTVQNGGNYTAGQGLSKYGLGGAGGGIAISVSSPRIVNNRITRNGLAYDTNTPPPGVASWGAGIYCQLGSPLIVSNTIVDNEILNDFDGSGGAVYFSDSTPVIERNLILRNHARRGSALYGVHSSPQIVANVIASNAMYNTYPLPLYLGSTEGAITLQSCGDFLVEGNTIQANTAAQGAGINLVACQAGSVRNNLILGNRAYDPTSFGGIAGGVYCLLTTNAAQPVSIVHNTIVSNVAAGPFGEQGGGLAFALPQGATNLVIANNLIVSNSSGLFRIPTMSPPDGLPVLAHNTVFNRRDNYQNLAPGETDRQVDPRFVDPEAGDYRLRPDSPCLDAGHLAYAPALDLEGVPRPLDSDLDGVAAPDPGAFERLHPEADSDRDELPDGWEWAHRLDPIVPDADDDPDQDGASNRAEYASGTNPRDPDSVLRLTIQPLASGSVRLNWFGIAGFRYDLEYATALSANPGWSPLPLNLVGADSPLIADEATATAATRLFRVRVRRE